MSDRPPLSVVIPTRGRQTLRRALMSIRDESQPPDVEILVVADTHSDLLDDVDVLADVYGAAYLEHDAGFHGYGHPQIMAGYRAASGRWLLALGDDDEYLPGALSLVRTLTKGRHAGVLLFRIEMHPSASRRVPAPFTIWRDPVVAVGNVSGQSICLPNDPGMLPPSYPPHSTGDHEFIAEVVARYESIGVMPEWHTELLCVCR